MINANRHKSFLIITLCFYEMLCQRTFKFLHFASLTVVTVPWLCCMQTTKALRIAVAVCAFVLSCVLCVFDTRLCDSVCSR